MDSKVTLSFKRSVAEKAKRYAQKNNMSLSRLVELLLDKATSEKVESFEQLPVSDWVNQLADGETIYQTKSRSRKNLTDEFFKNRK